MIFTEPLYISDTILAVVQHAGDRAESKMKVSVVTELRF